MNLVDNQYICILSEKHLNIIWNRFNITCVLNKDKYIWFKQIV